MIEYYLMKVLIIAKKFSTRSKFSKLLNKNLYFKTLQLKLLKIFEGENYFFFNLT